MKITTELNEEEIMDLKSWYGKEESKDNDDKDKEEKYNGRYSRTFCTLESLNDFIDSMLEQSELYGYFTVADFKSEVDMYRYDTDYFAGWTEKEIREDLFLDGTATGGYGYTLVMPEVHVLDRFKSFNTSIRGQCEREE